MKINNKEGRNHVSISKRIIIIVHDYTSENVVRSVIIIVVRFKKINYKLDRVKMSPDYSNNIT